MTSATANDLLGGRVVDIGGMPVGLRALDLPRAEAMDFLRRLPFHPGAPAISMLFTDRAPPHPPGPPDELHDELAVWREGEVIHLDWRGEFSVRASRSAIDIGVRGADLFPVLSYLFPFTIAYSLAFHGRMVLRGGAIVRGRNAVMVLGDFGAGKSTTVLAALKNGWGALSDDSVVLSTEGGRVHIGGIVKEFYVPPETLAESDTAHPAPVDDRGRWILTGPEWSPGNYELAGTVVVKHGGQKGSRLGRIGRSASLRSILESFSANLPGGGEPAELRRVRQLAGSAASLPAWELFLPADPAVRIAGVARRLDTVAAKLNLAGS